jgi:hypothetical protein
MIYGDQDTEGDREKYSRDLERIDALKLRHDRVMAAFEPEYHLADVGEYVAAYNASWSEIRDLEQPCLGRKGNF